VHQGGSWRHGLLRGAWRGQAVPRGGLHQVCARRHGLLRGARRGQALPARGLPQVCSWRHGCLQCTWRWQAMPARGLPQGSCYRRHAQLHRAWRRQAVPERGLLQGSRSSSRQHALHAVSAAHTAAARRCGGAVALRARPVTQLARARGDPAAGGGLRINQFTAEARPVLLVGCLCTHP
jgi:hypothetical protein